MSDPLMVEIHAELETLSLEIDTYEATLPLNNLKVLAGIWCNVTNGTRTEFMELMKPILEPSMWLALERNINRWWIESVS